MAEFSFHFIVNFNTFDIVLDIYYITMFTKENLPEMRGLTNLKRLQDSLLKVDLKYKDYNRLT